MAVTDAPRSGSILKTPMRRVLLLIVLCVSLPHEPYAVYPAPAAAGTDMGSWRLVYSQRFGADVRTVFKWDEHRFGLLAPSKRVIYVAPAESGRPLERITLSDAFRAEPGGTIFPDPVERGSNRAIYWFSKASQRVGVFRTDGSLIHDFPIWADPFWMQVLPDGSVRLSARNVAERKVVYEEYRSSGYLVRTATRWLIPDSLGSDSDARDIGKVFFSELGDAWVEAFAYFPYARIRRHGREHTVFLTCDQLSPQMRKRFERYRLVDGLPRDVATDAGRSQPFALSFTTVPNAAFFLLNGRALMRLDIASGATKCWRVPTGCDTDERSTVVLTSVAASARRLAILSNDGCLRVWELGKGS